MPGYISLHRDIQKHWLYEEVRVFSRYEAWLDILMRVNHAEGKVTHNGTVETVLRGSTIWSMGDMEKHWKWSNSKVRAFLKRLESDGMVSVKSTTKKTYLTVVNYDFYQDVKKPEAPPKHHQSTTETFQKHTNNNELIMSNNDKEISSTTAEPETLDEIHRLIFGNYNMTGMISGFVVKCKQKGFTEAFIREVLMEAAETCNNGKPNIRQIETIADRWERDMIFSRAQNKRDRDNVKQFPKGGQPDAKHGTGHDRYSDDDLNAMSL